nr:1,4-alpha-glucan branching protein GlgB [Tropicimonas sp. IMCC6043]
MPLSPETAQQIAAGALRDPFAILGPHEAADGNVWVTVFDPGASQMSVITERKEFPLARVDGVPGVFCGKISSRVPYRVRGTNDAGETWENEDPYRFGPVIGEMDEYLLGEGTHQRIWQVLGAHVMEHEGVPGTHFAVWAPNAKRVSVICDFNAWDGRRNPMRLRGATGVWEIFLPGIGEGTPYKYEIIGAQGQLMAAKADPVGFGAEHPPATASMVRDIRGYGWDDDGWMRHRSEHNAHDKPISIYEVHLGSWKRKRDEGNRPLSYREAAVELVDYAKEMGFTHLEFLPISEFPFDGSWGYQPIGLFAPTIRHGPPHEFRDLVEAAHLAGLGVILDWVPGHFPSDVHGLTQFDGTALYEHADPREGFHHDWNTMIYNFGRAEVANFLISNALYWLEEYHVDGLRVDAVASMLYRDYSRKEGEWIPNIHGGRENLEAISLLQRTNTICYGEVPGIMTAAEESTSFPGVSKPVDTGGLGFGFKWNMGWMNDTLDYVSRDPIHRRHHHHQMTFGIHYAFSENFILPISHDEVVHGKGSMLTKMPGLEGERFANLRAYYGFMWGHPGKKLLFMGCEIAQWAEWNYKDQIDWNAAEYHTHAGVQTLVRDLNFLYRETPSLYVKDCEPGGFEWLEANDMDNSIFAWIRRGGPKDPEVVVACNFTPIERMGYRIGLPAAGKWRMALNTDAKEYGGGGRGDMNGVTAEPTPWHGQDHSAPVTLPPLTTVILVRDTN